MGNIRVIILASQIIINAFSLSQKTCVIAKNIKPPPTEAVPTERRQHAWIDASRDKRWRPRQSFLPLLLHVHDTFNVLISMRTITRRLVTKELHSASVKNTKIDPTSQTIQFTMVTGYNDVDNKMAWGSFLRRRITILSA
ncbi:hypothetical protein TNCV_1296091 [Trichonephila clavipes]|uniref:Uncharacterized protein n=1 Tax=Trichonephila clavipes TaxID=2585209 RepID=A0A8X6SM50_TRICX|nr:hypothetical protein TNCV_1296091 [Trichonephila clavipes]